jgi:hypothetical protein
VGPGIVNLEELIAGCPDELRQELALVFMWAAHGVGENHIVAELDRARNRYLNMASRLGMTDGRTLERQTVLTLQKTGS